VICGRAVSGIPLFKRGLGEEANRSSRKRSRNPCYRGWLSVSPSLGSKQFETFKVMAESDHQPGDDRDLDGWTLPRLDLRKIKPTQLQRRKSHL
jgi:hypothetical protein